VGSSCTSCSKPLGSTDDSGLCYTCAEAKRERKQRERENNSKDGPIREWVFKLSRGELEGDHPHPDDCNHGPAEFFEMPFGAEAICMECGLNLPLRPGLPSCSECGQRIGLDPRGPPLGEPSPLPLCAFCRDEADAADDKRGPDQWK
jgi:hypothetical protein